MAKRPVHQGSSASVAAAPVDLGEPSAQLVVIGSSAGGIDALTRVVAGLPTDFSVPVVIAQHLDPRRPSHLREILSRHTTLRVVLVEDHAQLASGVIFVVPSNRHVTINDHEIRLRERTDGESTPSVDLLLSSAAASYGAGLIAVILTGSGSDGSAGARDVKAAGGTIVIENPETAAFPSMPLSLAPSLVDVVAELDSMGRLLADIVAMPAQTLSVDSQELAGLLGELRDRSGIDFGSYKQGTVVRRLRNRLAATNSTSIEAYRRLVARDDAEYNRLVSNLLIKVTEFFRDQPVWEYLRERVLPGLIDAARTEGRELRFWSAGCATGEEAYSLAILASEALGGALSSVDVRVFATDADPEAIAFARRGLYPAAALAHLPERLRSRHFNEEGGVFKVAKPIRELVLFGAHDLGARSPFARIDLILCRNVLIYFNVAMQRSALETFAFSLHQGGYLVLGPSETVGPLPDPFVEQDGRLRVYQRTAIPRPNPFLTARAIRKPRERTSTDTPLTRAIAATHRDQARDKGAGELLQRLVLSLAEGVVVVDSSYDVWHINSAARRLLGVHGTAFGQDFVHLATVIPPGTLRAAIDTALAGKKTTTIEAAVTADTVSGDPVDLRIVVSPFRLTGETPGALIELFDVSAERRAEVARERLTKRIHGAGAANKGLVDANEELATTIALLRSSNEAMLAASEETQLAREEIETLNEELQATNEELETLNEELTSSVEELTTANDDLLARTQELRLQGEALTAERLIAEQNESRTESILSSLGDAVVAVDRGGAIVLANAAYLRMFGANGSAFEPMDVAGGPLPAAQWPHPRAAAGERFAMEFTHAGADGERHWFEALAEPLTIEDRIWGGVVTIRDVTERTMRLVLEQVMATASHELRTPVAAVHGYAQLIESALREGDAISALEYAMTLRRQSSELGGFIEQLFDVSRMRTGQLELALEAIDLRDIAQRAVDTASGLAGAPPFEMAAENGAVPVSGDRTRLAQLVLILLANAAQHAPESQRIVISLRRSKGLGSIAVRDFGPGIASGDLPLLFKAFSRLGSRHRGRGSGLGLGLFLAQRIAAAHGGEIVVDSTVGAGTTFTVYLPLRAEPDAAAELPAEAAGAGPTARALAAGNGPAAKTSRATGPGKSRSPKAPSPRTPRRPESG